MKTLKINVPEGYEIDKEQSTFENIVFKEIKKELPRTWEGLGGLNGYFVDVDCQVIQPNWTSIIHEHNRNIFATKEQAEASIALAQLSQLREVYRQGWKPDWSDTNQITWGIFFDKDKSRVTSFSNFNHFFSFQSKEIASQFLENFRDLIEKARPLMS
jgi:hypothetical protein